MARFDVHSKCKRCHKKGIEVDPCVLKKDCEFCIVLTSEQMNPTLQDPQRENEDGQTGKKKAASDKSTYSKEASNKKSKLSSSASSGEDIRALDGKWSQWFARREAMLLAKTFTMSGLLM